MSTNKAQVKVTTTKAVKAKNAVNADALGSMISSAPAPKRKASETQAAIEGKRPKRSPAHDAEDSGFMSADLSMETPDPLVGPERDGTTRDNKGLSKVKRVSNDNDVKRAQCKARGLLFLERLNSADLIIAKDAKLRKDSRYAVRWKEGTLESTKVVFAKALDTQYPTPICQVEVETFIRYFEYNDIYGTAFWETTGNEARLGKSTFDQTKLHLHDGKLVYGDKNLKVIAAEDWEEWLISVHRQGEKHLPYYKIKSEASKYNGVNAAILDALVGICCKAQGGTAPRQVRTKEQQNDQSAKLLASKTSAMNSAPFNVREAEKTFKWSLPELHREAMLVVEDLDACESQPEWLLAGRLINFWEFMFMFFMPADANEGIARQAVHFLYERFCDDLKVLPISSNVRGEVLKIVWKVLGPAEKIKRPYGSAYWGLKCRDVASESLLRKLQTDLGEDFPVFHSKSE